VGLVPGDGGAGLAPKWGTDGLDIGEGVDEEVGEGEGEREGEGDGERDGEGAAEVVLVGTSLLLLVVAVRVEPELEREEERVVDGDEENSVTFDSKDLSLPSSSFLESRNRLR